MPEKRKAADEVYYPEDGSVVDFVSQRLETKRLRVMQDSDQEGANSELESELELESDEEPESESESESESQLDSEDDSDDENSWSSPAKAGIIKKISLRNFMCHDAFDLELGPQLNFIIGRNGSGKSAILTGISVGLGAKATDTNRGNSVRSFIKDGKQTARVQLTLSNEGIEAYKPQEYGSEITIERKFQRNGTNNYYLRSQSGKTISTKKGDLDDMLYRFNITVDNPLSFLSQDKAREFLTATTDKAKYDYFMAGALINDILENYRYISQNIVDVQQRSRLIKSELELAIKKYEESANAYNRFKKSDYLRKQLELINGKMYWFNVQVIENKIIKYQHDLNGKLDELNCNKSDLESIKEKLKGFDSEKKILETNVHSTESELNEAIKESTELKQKVKDIKSNIDLMSDEMKNYHEEIKSLTLEIKNSKKELELEQQKFDEISGGSKEAIKTQISRLKDNLKDLEQSKDQFNKELNSMNGDTPEISKQKEQISFLQDSLNASKEKKRHFDDLKKDKYIPWGPGISKVLSDISKLNQWHRKPIGPIGLFVGVKDEFSDWRDIINTSIGKSLDSFLVHDDHDRRILDSLLKRHHINKNIITRKFEKFDFSRGKVKDQTTMLDALEIYDENVLYTLVDTNYIEQNVLAQNRNIARKILSENPNIRNVFSLLDHKSGFRSQQDGATFRIDPIFYRTREPHKLARKSSDDDIQKVDLEIEENNMKLNLASRELRRLRMIWQNSIEEIERQRSQVDSQIRKVEDEIFNLENRLNENVDVSILETLQERIKENTKMIKQKQAFISGLEDDRKSDAIKFNEAKAEYIKAKETQDSLDHRLKIKRKTLEDLETSFEIRTTEILRMEQAQATLQESISHIENKLSRANKVLEEHIKGAEERCKRDDVTIKPEDTVESITTEYEKTQEAVKESERHIGRSYEEIQSELISNKKTKDELEKHASSLEQISRKLDEDLNQRLKYLQTTIFKQIRESSASFEQSLALRGFKGELRFGFAEKTLTMLVQTKGDAKKRTVESLSGGEKSFTQIALLLAIWRAMNSKIRGLDEFDVFMDSVNRSISIRLLLTELRKYPKSQSIFITPQDIAVVGDLDSKDIRIHKMNDPRNGN